MINPPDVYFSQKVDEDGRSTASIDLLNKSNQCIIFTVKTTDPGKFIVKPNNGQLSPESSTKIKIYFIGSIEIVSLFIA
jgi:hypothetical protein